MKTQTKTPATTLAQEIKKTAAKKKVPAKQKQAEPKVKTQEVYTLKSNPRGKALFTYTLAVLSYLGGFTSGRKVMKKEAIRAFYQSGTILNHHTKNGNLEETKTGIRLTVTGWNYFNGRLTGSTIGQTVDKPEMETLKKAIATGKLERKTAHFPTDTVMVKTNIPA